MTLKVLNFKLHMEDSFQDSGTWEFLALLKETVGPWGVKCPYFVTGIRINDIVYEDTVIATGYPLFAQFPAKEFERLQQLGYLKGVRPAEEYIKWYDWMYRNKPYEEDRIHDLSENDEDHYGLKLENWKSSDTPAIELTLRPITRGEELQSLYPFSHIGIADISVMGRFNEMIFVGAQVTRSDCLEKPILGFGMVGVLSSFTISLFEDKGLAIHGFVQH